MKCLYLFTKWRHYKNCELDSQNGDTVISSQHFHWFVGPGDHKNREDPHTILHCALRIICDESLRFY